MADREGSAGLLWGSAKSTNSGRQDLSFPYPSDRPGLALAFQLLVDQPGQADQTERADEHAGEETTDRVQPRRYSIAFLQGIHLLS